MEEEPSDPHEQQLLAVFKSCIAEGQSKLSKDGLLLLCSKLDLEESHKDAILELLKINAAERSVSFYEFRDAFVALLGISQETPDSSQKRIGSELENVLCKSKQLSREQAEAIISQQLMTNVTFNQRMQETWSNQNSFTTEDVNSFNHKGFTLPKQMIELIFEKLDVDCDGLINLDEFLNFFQNATNKLQIQSSWSPNLQDENNKSVCCKDFVYNPTGYVLRSIITEMWEVAGVSEPSNLLHDLGFDAPTINVVDLTNALSSELKLHHDVSHTGSTEEYLRLLRGALKLYQEEVRNLNLRMESVCDERDKLRAETSEAKERANLLAQEVDEHQARMDKDREEQLLKLELKHMEALKELSEQLQMERDRSSASHKSLEQQLHASQQEEQRISAELSNVLTELRLLESENRQQAQRIAELETNNQQLNARVLELAAEHDQVEIIETRENEQVSDLMSHIKRLQTEMKIQRDHNDELTTELEILKHRSNDAKSAESSVGVRSSVSDENDGLASIPANENNDTEDGVRQKYSYHSKLGRVRETKSLPSDSNSNSNGSSINKLSEIIQEFRNFLTGAKFCAECVALRNEVSSLISELELYQSSVPGSSTSAIISNNKNSLNNLANELGAEYNDQKSGSCRDLVMSANDKFKVSKRVSSSDDRIHNLDDSVDNLAIRTMKNKGLRDYPFHSDVMKSRRVIGSQDASKQSCLQALLKEEELKNAAEKKKLSDRCSELEKSLELLKAEYEQCEDYWSSKLEEERQLYEQEQKISDDKLSELITKMSEYEEQFGKSSDGRLSPIDERASLEQQYNELEEEFERWRLDAQLELDTKEREIDELRARLGANQRLPASLTDISVQFPDNEHLGNQYPQLYSVLCAPGTTSEDQPDSSSTSAEPKLAAAAAADAAAATSRQQCPQCHKAASSSCDCHVNTQQSPQQQQQHHRGEQRARRSDGKNRHHHHQKMDHEYHSLAKQKEKLKQEIMKLQSLKAINGHHIYPLIGTQEQNILGNLYSKLFAQEQKLKYLQMFCHTQQKEHQRIVQGMWNQHLLETADLKFVIKAVEDKLNQQMRINKEQNEKLTKSDFLVKEIYVENAQLTETVKRLEQHCQILTQNRIDSTST